MVIIDEIERSLHPTLVEMIINFFHNSKINKKNAQLIFSTHDTNLLSLDLFRRDQIWFAEKDKDGISTIYSLSDYKINDTKVRNDATYNKDYLSGRYGAIPVLEDFNIL